MTVFFIYIFLSTFYIANGCDSKIFKKNIEKLFIIICYSLICTGYFYFIHETWKNYKKNTFYKLFLFILPFVYFMNIK